MKIIETTLALHILWMLAGCEYNPDSIVICDANSRESVFARSLSAAQLETLYSDSMELMAASGRGNIYDSTFPGSPPIPSQFAYLNPIKIRVLSSDVGFHLKGCLDEHIYLHVNAEEVVLSYSTGSAVDMGQEVLWSATNGPGLE